MRASSSSEESTKNLGAAVARATLAYGKRVDVKSVFVRLKGGLGAGKSTFARGFITEWLLKTEGKSPQSMPSPTFTIANTYGDNASVAHLDLYRLESFDALEAIGYEQYFYQTPICLVEWLENIPGYEALLPSSIVTIEFLESVDELTRQIEISAHPQILVDALIDEAGELLFKST